MLRLLGFFGLTAVAFVLLTKLPVVGGLARGVPLLGFFAAAAIVSAVLTRAGQRALARSRERALMRQLGAVETPYNKGKLGTLLLKQRSWRRAAPLLAEASAGEPRSAEWAFNLGRAELGAGRPAAAVAALERAVELDEEHAYGAALMRLAEARLASGDAAGSLAALDRLERNHGESPEGAFRRGRALQALGRGADARRAFGRVAELAREAVGYQRREAAGWALRAAAARYLPAFR